MTAQIGAAPGWWRRLLGGGRTLTIFVLGVLTDWVGIMNVPGAATFSTQPQHTARITTLGAVLALTIIACWLSVFVRRQYPLLVAIAGVALALIGVSYLLLLIGSYHLLLRQPKRTTLIAGSAGVVIAFYVLREALTDWGYALSWLFGGAAPANQAVWAITSVIVAALSMGLVATLVAYQRTRIEASDVSRRSKELTKRTQALEVRLANQAERDRIARDLHDGLGHRLSSITLAAGAFESQAANAQLDPELTKWAQLIRQQAHAALEDVREVVGGLRAEQIDPGVGSGVSLRQASQLLTDMRAAGHRIDGYVFIESIEQIDRECDVAAFPILQEALTNAIKHAPEAIISVTLEASPDKDVRIRVVNQLTNTYAAMPGGQRGIEGIRERAAAVGGQAWIGPHEGEFIVDASLPWSSEHPR